MQSVASYRMGRARGRTSADHLEMAGSTGRGRQEATTERQGQSTGAEQGEGRRKRGGQESSRIDTFFSGE